jgi:MoxR-like ATPase
MSYDRKENAFVLRKGPIFTQILLGRRDQPRPAKTQSALLEAMQENQVTIEGTTLPLPWPFMVLATQNPVEQEGVYRLPEAAARPFSFTCANSGYPGRRPEIDLIASGFRISSRGEDVDNVC